MGKKTIDGVKVPRKILGYKLRKGTRKDIAALVKAVGHPDAKSLIAAALGVIGPTIAERLTHGGSKLKAVK